MKNALSTLLSRHKGTLVFIFVFLILVLPHVAFAQQAGGPTPTGVQQAPSPGGECNVITLNVSLNGCVNAIIIAVAGVFLSAASFMAYIGGSLFNFAIVTLVVQFPHYFGNSAGMLKGWSVLRDIGNILLLFGFVYTGLMTVLDVGPASQGKLLPRLVIFAVLLNFSLFVAEGVIDVTNAVTTQLVQQVAAPCPDGGIWSECAVNQGISSQIFTRTGIMSALNTQGAVTLSAQVSANPAMTFMSDVLLIFFIATVACLLLFAAFMLISRALMLALVMITSPIGFAGMAIPQLNGLADMWWKALLNNALFAPVLILLMLTTLKITDGVAEVVLGAGKAPNLAALFVQDGGSGAVGSLLLYALVIGFLLASITVAKNMGAFGATWAANTASALTYGGMARMTNGLIGGSAFAVRKLIVPALPSPTLRAGINRALRPIESFNADLRRIPGVGTALGAAGITAGAKPAEFLATAHDAEHLLEEKAKEKRTRNADFQRERGMEQLENKLHDHKDLNVEDERLLNSMSADELAKLHPVQQGEHGIARALSPSKFKALMDLKEGLDTGAKNLLRDDRFKPFAKFARETNRDGIRNMDPEDVKQFVNSPNFSKMDDFQKAEFMSLLKDEQSDAAIKSPETPPQLRKDLKALRSARFDAKTQVYDPVSKTPMSRLERTLENEVNTPEKVANLEPNEITHVDMMPKLNFGDILAIQRKGNLPKDKRILLSDYLEKVLKRNPPMGQTTEFQTQWSRIHGDQKVRLRNFYSTTTKDQYP